MTKPIRRTYELPWRYHHRLVFDHLGRSKYTTSTKALGELVANALDASAMNIRITVNVNALGGIASIRVEDDGLGMTPDDIRERFVFVAVDPAAGRDSSSRLGRFGVGRFAVHRIGTLSKWTTVSRVAGRTLRTIFTIRPQEEPLKVDEELLSPQAPTGTVVEIFNIIDSGKDAPTRARIRDELVGQYCSFLLGNPGRRIYVDDEELDVRKMIRSQETVELSPSSLVPSGAHLQHLLLSVPSLQSKLPAQLLFSAKGRTVATTMLDDPPSPAYVGIVECTYLNSIVSANRESLIDMDGGFAQLRESALQAVQQFSAKLRGSRGLQFIEGARQQAYYPYPRPASDAVGAASQAVYDVVLEKMNEHANLEGMTRKQQAVVFRLLHRALANENLLDVLHEVANLSDDDVAKFKRVLERTTLDSIIKLSSEVTARLGFLDVLQGLIYGELGRVLKERSHLHLILEPHCWVFGNQFHLATSDQDFRNIIRRHRVAAGLEEAGAEAVNGIAGVNNIPDLFLFATRDYPMHPKHVHLLVELKAPRVKLGRKELEQVQRYADIVLSASEFEKTSTHWQIVLVSADVKDEIERIRQQKDKPHGCVYEWDSMSVWAFRWSEIISRRREEMQLVRDHLQKKSSELAVSDYLRENFPDILNDIEARSIKDSSG